jgi:hypothetical protein
VHPGWYAALAIKFARTQLPSLSLCSIDFASFVMGAFYTYLSTIMQSAANFIISSLPLSDFMIRYAIVSTLQTSFRPDVRCA